MKQLLFWAFSLSLLWSCQSPESPKANPLAYLVNPFIGTGAHGHTYPGASAPFGFMQLSPDTRLEGWDGCGGYHYTDSVIYGFSHTHLSGTGISDYGDLLIMPFTGEAHFNNGSELGVDQGYASRFSHGKENAHAGFYAVHLEDYNIEVELSAALRSGMHRYRFPEAEEAGIVIDLEHRDKLLDFSLKIIDDSTIVGHRISKAWAQEQHFYFYLRLSQAMLSKQFNSEKTKLIAYFKEPKTVSIKVGISAVSIAGAEKNLQEEIPHWSFDSLREETESKWQNELAKTEVKMPQAFQDSIFYTALYHAYLNPNIFHDVDGQYRGTDLQVHKSENFDQYTLFSLWDTYRAAHPLFTITQQKRSESFIRSFLQQYKDGGKLPMWELAGNYTGCMIGYHSVPVIVDAYAKGINAFDTALALEAMLATANAEELGKTYFRTFGYAASNEEHESVSKNLEYAYNDWCIAQFAKAIGAEKVYQEFSERAQYYQNIFDPETGFMRPKRKQMFLAPFDPAEVNFNFTEANSWQYSFYVPQDVNQLIKLHGGKEGFEAKLDALFNASEETSGRKQADITGLIGQYAHGNEPSHHMAYLYSFADASSKTQLMVRRILDEMYHNEPEGLSGNEDCGQMSAWYVLSAMGFYPVTPGSTQYIIGSPLIATAKLNLENGKVLEITVENQSAENRYIQSMTWNSEPYELGWIEHENLMAGGKWTLVMGPKPGKSLKAPVSEITEHLITPVPYFKNESGIFKDSLVLSLHCIDPDAKIYYTLKSGDPDTNSRLYEEPLVLKQNTVVSARAYSKGKVSSKKAASVFVKLNTNRSLSYSTPYDPQYTGGSDAALLDGIRGGHDFRTGAWQGWQGKDLSLIIDLGPEGENIGQIWTSHMQDIKSWIFMPKEVRFYASRDGENYELLGSAQSETPDTSFGFIEAKYNVDFSRRRAYFIKIEIEHYGPLPKGHISAGEPSWMFIDEIFIR